MGADALVMSARWEMGEKTMAWMRNVLDDVSHPAQAAFVIIVLDGG